MVSTFNIYIYLCYLKESKMQFSSPCLRASAVKLVTFSFWQPCGKWCWSLVAKDRNIQSTIILYCSLLQFLSDKTNGANHMTHCFYSYDVDFGDCGLWEDFWSFALLQTMNVIWNEFVFLTCRTELRCLALCSPLLAQVKIPYCLLQQREFGPFSVVKLSCQITLADTLLTQGTVHCLKS